MRATKEKRLKEMTKEAFPQDQEKNENGTKKRN